MSGITKLLKQMIMVTFLLTASLQFSSVSAIEKTTKVKTAQSSVKMVSAMATSPSHKDLTIKSAIMGEHRASYKDVSDPGLMIEKNNIQKSLMKIDAVTKLRPKNVATQLKSSAFYFSSAYVSMNIDRDGDGYYSDFSVNFDADTNYNNATVYALLYLSFEGGPWELYYSTNSFTLNGSSAYDDFTVNTLLTNGFPPGSYDILIDLYDEYDNALVATMSSYDNYALAEHFLEDASYDESVGIYSEFSIFDASITLLEDHDNDGFYQSFSLQFDADIDSGSALVYAEIWLQDSSGNWQLDHQTNDFIIEGYSTLDSYILETTLESGYNRGYYNFSIELYDAYTDYFLTSSASLNYQLSEVPLEDALSDVQTNIATIPVTNSGTTSISYGEGGGGSMGLLVLVLPLLLRRRG